MGEAREQLDGRFRRAWTTPGGLRAGLAGLVIAVAVLVCCGAADAALPAGQTETYVVPQTIGGFAGSITSGPDGALWFADAGSGEIYRVTTAGVFSEFPSATANVDWITSGPSGNGDLWFSDVGDGKVGEITPSGTQTEYSIDATYGGLPEAITAGPDSALWLTVDLGDSNLGAVDRIPTTATLSNPGVTQFTIPTANPYAEYITTGPDGNLWFAETDTNKIGNLTPTGTFTEYSLPSADTEPGEITAGPNDALWFLDHQGIGEISTAGVVTQFTLTAPAGSSGVGEPQSIAAGPDGNIWFGATDGIKTWIGRMTPTGTVTYYLLTDSDVDVNSMTTGPDGNMWFTEEDPAVVGEVGTFSGTGPSLEPSDGLAFGNSTLGQTSSPQSVTVTNTGNTPLLVGTAQIVAPAGTPFAITSDHCSGQTLAPSGTCAIGVTFSPATPGSYSASLQVPDNAAGSPQSLPLSGSSEPVLASPGINFGSVGVDEDEGPSDVNIENSGGAPLLVSGVQLAGPQSSAFEVVSDHCSGQSVPPGGSCTVGVSFSPQTDGASVAALTVSDNATGSPQSVPLTGTGVAPTLNLSPSSLTFGAVTTGTSSTETVTVSDPGAASVTFSAVQFAGPQADAFSISADSCSGKTVTPGDSCTIAVTFVPTGGGSFSASLVIADDSASPSQSVPLGGSGDLSSANLSGVVTNGSAGGAPVSSESLTACPVDPSLAAECVAGQTAADGSYKFPALPAGLWHMQAWPVGLPEVGNSESASGALTGASADVTLAPGSAVIQNLVVQTPVPLSDGVTFTGAEGTTTSGEPIEYYGLPFSMSVPIQVSDNQPNSTRVYAFLGSIGSGGGTGVNLAGALLFSVHFDASGHPAYMSNIVEAELDCGPLGSASPCADLPDVGSAGSAPSVRADSVSALRAVDPVAVAAQDCGSPTGPNPNKGQFNLTPAPNGGIVMDVYIGFGDYIQIPLDPIGFAPPQPTGNAVADAALSLDVDYLNGIVTHYYPYNTVIGVLNNYATVMNSTNGALTAGNAINGVVTVAVGALGGSMHGQFQWAADVINNTLGNVLGSQQGSLPPTPCPPPPGPGGPGGGGGGGSGGSGGGGGSFYVDPSGLVTTTRGVPLADAKVTLTRAGTARGMQLVVPNGSTIMAPSNRVNPSLSGPLGTFGWDVLPGYYEVSASRKGCTAPDGGLTQHSGVHQVPPAVDDLALTLRCRAIRRHTTRIRLTAMTGPHGSFVLRARLTSRGRRVPFLGTIAFKFGSRTLGSTTLTVGAGTAVIDGVGLRRGVNAFTASYSGDATLAPVVGRVRLSGVIKRSKRP